MVEKERVIEGKEIRDRERKEYGRKRLGKTLKEKK